MRISGLLAVGHKLESVGHKYSRGSTLQLQVGDAALINFVCGSRVLAILIRSFYT